MNEFFGSVALILYQPKGWDCIMYDTIVSQATTSPFRSADHFQYAVHRGHQRCGAEYLRRVPCSNRGRAWAPVWASCYSIQLAYVSLVPKLSSCWARKSGFAISIRVQFNIRENPIKSFSINKWVNQASFYGILNHEARDSRRTRRSETKQWNVAQV